MSTVSSALDRLERCALINRTRASTDRRVVCVELTSRGKGPAVRSQGLFMAIIAITRLAMRSVNIAELKNRLSTYLTYAKNGEVVVIRDRNLPVAKLIAYHAEDASEEELALVAAGAMRLPEEALDLERLWKMPRATVRENAAMQAVLDERDEGR
jgi:prevent-host-death family protein